jgi:hypothetical protein
MLVNPIDFNFMAPRNTILYYFEESDIVRILVHAITSSIR